VTHKLFQGFFQSIDQGKITAYRGKHSLKFGFLLYNVESLLLSFTVECTGGVTSGKGVKSNQGVTQFFSNLVYHLRQVNNPSSSPCACPEKQVTVNTFLMTKCYDFDVGVRTLNGNTGMVQAGMRSM
jgi:hypothetical protein